MIAITNARLMTMKESGVINQATILIDGEFILAAGQDILIPSETEIIDAGGKWICPGFIDAHTHIGLEEEIYGEVGDDVNESTNPITPELQALDGINCWDLAFEDALRGGVTRTMSMPGSANIIGGQAVFLKNLARNKAEMVYKNPWGLKAALGENPKRVYKEKNMAPRTRMANASLLRESFYVALRLMDKKDIDAVEEYKKEPIFKVLRQEMPLLVHAHRADDIMTALRLKDEFNIDLIIQHGTEGVLVADELVKRNVPVFFGPLLVNRAKVEMKDVAFKNAALLAERGVKFCFITDHPVIPIEHLRLTAALSVREGLDENLALQAITSIPADLLGVGNELGTIQAGRRADMVIFSGHPLEFRSRVETVLVDGKLWRGDIGK